MFTVHRLHEPPTRTRSRRYWLGTSRKENEISPPNLLYNLTLESVMRLDANKLSSAVRLALSLGVAATAGSLGIAQAQTAADNNQKSQSLETIVVTGSNIRRVDIETANPVVTIDKAAIQQSGKLTLGDLVQDLTAVTGPVTNPRVNNGGGN